MSRASWLFGREPQRIVICYRREDTVDSTGRLLRDLMLHFERPFRNYLRRKVVVVRDFDNIPAGINYEDYIRAEITASVAVLVVIGNDWLKVVNPQTMQRRIDDPEDSLRKEITTALTLSKPLIPVLVERARMPGKEELPDALKELATINAREVYDPEWDAGVVRLIKDLDAILNSRWVDVGSGAVALGALALLMVGGVWGASKVRGLFGGYGVNENLNVNSATPSPSPTHTPDNRPVNSNGQHTPTATPTPSASATPTPATPTATPTPTPTPAVASLVGTQWDVMLEGNVRYVWDFLPEGRLRSRHPDRGTYLPDGKWQQNGDSVLIQTSITTPNPETYTGTIRGDRMEGTFIGLEQYSWYATRRRLGN